MQTIPIRASKHYNVLVGRRLIPGCGELIAQRINAGRAAVITDDVVDSLYGEAAALSLENAGFSTFRKAFPHGEKSKDINTLSQVLEWLAELRFTRADIIVALGGGVVGDLAGFAAAVYLRGVRFVQIPTTFLAAVDSSVGGKTAVNLRAGKNLMGAFWQPELVICDCDTFKTLPADIFADGVAEGIKYGAILDEALFSRFAGDSLGDEIEEITARCIEIKGGLVAMDEFDLGARQLLNFGHTIGHAVEKCSGFTITHGHAVAIGMAAITRASVKMGIARGDCLSRLISVLEKQNLPVSCAFSPSELFEAACGDKKRRGKEIALVVPKTIGECALHTVKIDELEGIIQAGLA